MNGSQVQDSWPHALQVTVEQSSPRKPSVTTLIRSSPSSSVSPAPSPPELRSRDSPSPRFRRLGGQACTAWGLPPTSPSPRPLNAAESTALEPELSRGDVLLNGGGTWDRLKEG